MTHSFVASPFSTARFASKPAPKITLGFDVLVQLVIAAIRMLPSLITPSELGDFFNFFISLSDTSLTSERRTLSCGRLGPERQASTSPISKDNELVYLIS